MSEKEFDNIDADVILCWGYLRFIAEYNAKPQVIRVASDILDVLVPLTERNRPLRFFGAEVILDDTLLNGTSVCQWKL
jgi:hypothetical protein